MVPARGSSRRGAARAVSQEVIPVPFTMESIVTIEYV